MNDFDEDTWWGSCVNTFHEEQKQLVYAPRLGLYASWNCAHPPTYDLGGRTVLDVGGGPVSLLLKCENFSEAAVVDPGAFPRWVLDRYMIHGVSYRQMPIEDGPAGAKPIDSNVWDEVWCYNVLQHIDDVELAVKNMQELGRVIRIFEWINIEPYPGHPQLLTKERLDAAFAGMGFIAHVNENGADGTAYYGVFSGV